MRNLDDKDKRILEMLLENARTSNKNIRLQLESEGISISESTVRKRIKRLRDDQIIEKFTVKLCQEDERCIIAFITIIPNQESEIKEILRETQILPQCEEVYYLAGECGVLIKAKVPEITELDALIESFKARSDVKSVEHVCVVLKLIKTSSQSAGILL